MHCNSLRPESWADRAKFEIKNPKNWVFFLFYVLEFTILQILKCCAVIELSCAVLLKSGDFCAVLSKSSAGARGCQNFMKIPLKKCIFPEFFLFFSPFTRLSNFCFFSEHLSIFSDFSLRGCAVAQNLSRARCV